MNEKCYFGPLAMNIQLFFRKKKNSDDNYMKMGVMFPMISRYYLQLGVTADGCVPSPAPHRAERKGCDLPQGKEQCVSGAAELEAWCQGQSQRCQKQLQGTFLAEIYHTRWNLHPCRLIISARGLPSPATRNFKFKFQYLQVNINPERKKNPDNCQTWK